MVTTVSTDSCPDNETKNSSFLFYYHVNTGCTSTTDGPFQDGRHSWTSTSSTREMAKSLNFTDAEVKSDVSYTGFITENEVT